MRRTERSEIREPRHGVVTAVNLTKHFGEVTAVDNVSFRLEPGTFFALLGPSGCGKTTLLRMIAGFEQPSNGEIYINDQPVAGVPPYRRHVNTVFQHYALFPHMDVATNVGYGLRQQRPRLPRHEMEQRVADALRLVRLTGFEHRRVWELSGGQQQRVALARALINRPTVLLLDEPLGALDLKLRREMQVELKLLHEQVGITFIFVTHDQNEAFSMADRVAVMRNGVILQDGDPARIYDRPVNRWVASFIGQMNFFEGLVEATGEQGAIRLTRAGRVVRALMPDTAITAGRAALVSIRPERLWIRRGAPESNGQNGQSFSGRLVRSIFLGDQIEHTVESQELGRVLVRVPNVTAMTGDMPAAGEEVVIGWRDEAARVVLDEARG
ncbi:MAG TPA: ABC transporter ATP-binding protein [candidate division Zixibacteria bacterium]|nr:ABC transporter ATP-binding protein [candidate division Zixibacteria bacterium]